jgi:DNA-binding MarR family transcriptional regulator
MTNISIKKTPKLTTAPLKPGDKTQRSRRPRLTKKARLINFLSKERGADIGSLSKKLDWLPHTTRAALSKLRKSGYVITSAKARNSKLLRYRITSLPDGQGS